MSNQFLALIHDVAILFPTFLIVFTFRGFFKTCITSSLGDNTARFEGFLTLNPLSHLDVYGLLTWISLLYLVGGLLFDGFTGGMMLLFIIAMSIRWIFPIPVCEENFRWKIAGIFLSVLSGPFGILLLSLMFMYINVYFPYHLVAPHIARGCMELFGTVIEVSLWFGVIDLIPLPPFDAGYLLKFIIPQSYAGFLAILEEYALFIFLALFFLPVISPIFLQYLFGFRAFVESMLLMLVI